MNELENLKEHFKDMLDRLEHLGKINHTGYVDLVSSLDGLDVLIRADERRQTIEECAEVMANHMRCFDCPLDCNEADIDTCTENLKLFLTDLMEGEAE